MNEHKGFNIIELILAVAAVGLIAAVIWMFAANSMSNGPSAVTQSTKKPKVTSELIWRQTQNGWVAKATPPDCPSQPMLEEPTESYHGPTSILYPGQVRGSSYKPHGGYRFDNKSNFVSVSAPIDGFVVRGVSYIENGEIQYSFDIINNCGIMYRLDHLHDLEPTLQDVADTLPGPTEVSAMHQIKPSVFIPKLTRLAKSVGFYKSKNSFFDFGVYDLRSQNEASRSKAYQTAHTEDKELSWHAVCWLKGWLNPADEERLLVLPAGDPTNGKESDYCK